MDKYLVIQVVVLNEGKSDLQTEISMTTIARLVDADSKELAIGKFIISTMGIKGKSKLDVCCCLLEEVENI